MIDEVQQLNRTICSPRYLPLKQLQIKYKKQS